MSTLLSSKVLTFEIVDLMNDDREDSGWVTRIRRRTSGVSLLACVSCCGLDLELGMVLQFLWKIMIDSRLHLEGRIELRLFVVCH